MTKLIYIFSISIIFIASSCLAKQIDEVVVGEWGLNLAAGYGTLENPRTKADDVSIYLLPTWYYYGENVYVENFTLGYSLYENEYLVIDLQGQLNEDGLFFELDGLEKVFLSDVLGYTSIKQPTRPSPRINYQAIERKISYLGGISATWFTPVFDFSTGYFHDVTGVHDGYELQLSLHKSFSWSWGAVGFEIGASHKSKKLVHYYYAMTQEEHLSRSSPYQAEATTNYHVKGVINIPITERLVFVTTIQQTYLGRGIRESFLTDKDDYFAGFIGISYGF